MGRREGSQKLLARAGCFHVALNDSGLNQAFKEELNLRIECLILNANEIRSIFYGIWKKLAVASASQNFHTFISNQHEHGNRPLAKQFSELGVTKKAETTEAHRMKRVFRLPPAHGNFNLHR